MICVNMYMIIDTQDYHIQLEIDNNIDVVFKSIKDGQISFLKQALLEINIPNEKAVIILWFPCGRFYHNSIQWLNELYRSIKNPLVLFSGSLTADTSELDFIHQPINLFQYVAKIEQPKQRTITLAKSKKFLFLSTKDYWSRCYILQHLIKHHSDQGYISYRCLENLKHIENHLATTEIISACQSIEHLLPYGGLAEETDDNIYYATKPEYVINDTCLSILTETFYDSSIFLSEKVFYSMLYNHFFIYAGPAHTLEYLRSIGFKTFGHIIDESYDTIDDPVKRLYAVVDSIEGFLSKPMSEIKQLYIENLDILNHNRMLVRKAEINNLVNDTLYRAIQLKNSV